MSSSDASRGRHAVFPGTFDPPTLGHLDLVRRAVELFEHVTIAVAAHPTKAALFSVPERLELLRQATADLPSVRVDHFDGLLVDGCRRIGADVIVRGVRSGTDFDYEVTMARANRMLHPEVDTVLLVPDTRLTHITGTLARQVASMGGDVSGFVPPFVAEALAQRFRERSAGA
jgi:pantetheine-phosphate adenylyltransferase